MGNLVILEPLLKSGGNRIFVVKIENFFGQLRMGKTKRNQRNINIMSSYVKRPMSPYIAFCHARRDELRAANPTANFGDIAKILAALWKSKTQSERDAYANVAQTAADKMVTRESTNEPVLRRSSRLRNQQLGKKMP